uniref:Putative secreted salivary gland peptide n=1 Tax=Ixodes ricinus TaxID=34613 RepID=A0A147BEL3_IXORI
MLRFMTLLLAASTFGNGATVHDFNDYVDRAVGSTLPPLIRNAHSLYPEARIPFHTFELSEEYVWQNDIEVRLTEGAVKGLDVVTERSGSCGHPSQVMGATVTTCTLDLSGLEATYSVRTNRGEHIFAKRKRFSVDVRVASATASIVLASNGDRNARLVSFHLNHIGFVMSYDRDFDLDASRQKKFGEEVFDYTRSELTKIIEGSYFTALSQAFANTCFACR